MPRGEGGDDGVCGVVAVEVVADAVAGAVDWDGFAGAGAGQDVGDDRVGVGVVDRAVAAGDVGEPQHRSAAATCSGCRAAPWLTWVSGFSPDLVPPEDSNLRHPLCGTTSLVIYR